MSLALRHWSADFVGLPYANKGRDRDGCDCWGLLVIVFAERLGLTLPSYAGWYSSSDERAEIASIVARESASPVWHLVEGLPETFDIVFFRRGRLDGHAGLVLQPGLMLHMVDGEASKIERYDTGRWQRRLTGIYRFHRLVIE